MGEKNLFYESPSVRKFHCVLLTLCADVSSLCCCFPLSTRRPLALSLWAASKMVIIINMGFVGGNTGGLEAGGKGRKKKLLMNCSLLPGKKEVTNLTLAGAFLRFKGHFNSFILEDIVFKYLNINNEEMR